MPDNFFRTAFYCISAVALAAAGIIAVKNVATGDAEPSVPATSAEAAATLRQVAVSAGDDSPDLHQRDPQRAGQQSAAMKRAGALTVRSPRADSSFATGSAPAAASRMVKGASAPEPVIHVGSSAVELTVPVHPQSGAHARVPVALALAADPAGMSPEVQEAARQMAMDFLENVADVAAVADGARDAAYFERWQNAADLSDLEFRMRYGRIAYVQMNQAVAQEAAAGVR